jgi:hypothetical protein
MKRVALVALLLYGASARSTPQMLPSNTVGNRIGCDGRDAAAAREHGGRVSDRSDNRDAAFQRRRSRRPE